jgi:hypothetical protein
VYLKVKKLRKNPRGPRAHFRKFSKKKFMHRACVACHRGFDILPSLDPNPGRCDLFSSAGSSKIKIRTSSRSKSPIALLRDEVRILIFDDHAEQETSQRPEFVSPNSTLIAKFSTKFIDSTVGRDATVHCHGYSCCTVLMYRRKAISKTSLFLRSKCSVQYQKDLDFSIEFSAK